MYLLRMEIGAGSSLSKAKQLWAAAPHSNSERDEDSESSRSKDLICLGNGGKKKSKNHPVFPAQDQGRNVNSLF